MIRFDHVSKAYRGPDGSAVEALVDLDLEVAEGEALCLIGASGCGKTTALRMVNRLVDASKGRVLVEGRDVLDQDPIELRRRMGYVVQRGGLFPHRTVRENVGLLCRLEGWDPGRTRERVDELLEGVLLAPGEFGDRFPGELSGGQRQRVGVARALALDPGILLMDEPFGALDPITRRQLQGELQALCRDRGRTLVFVTHDLGEAFLLGDRVALLRGGQVAQVGTPDDLVNRPVDGDVADFVAIHGGGPA